MEFFKSYQKLIGISALFLSVGLAACDTQPKSNLRDRDDNNGESPNQKLTNQASTTELAAIGVATLGFSQKVLQFALTEDAKAVDECLTKATDKIDGTTTKHVLTATQRRCATRRNAVAGAIEVTVTKNAQGKIQSLQAKTLENGLFYTTENSNYEQEDVWKVDFQFTRVTDYTFNFKHTATVDSTQDAERPQADDNYAQTEIQLEGQVLAVMAEREMNSRMDLRLLKVNSMFRTTDDRKGTYESSLQAAPADDAAPVETQCLLPQGMYNLTQTFTEQNKRPQTVSGQLRIRGSSIRETFGGRSSSLQNCRSFTKGILMATEGYFSKTFKKYFVIRMATTSPEREKRMEKKKKNK